ncbi:hypothetical protein A4S05_35565 [Nostoc sp. KVJ20]|nr:hypothetical protein A4S05_35565 [Nostoc sp. KVJ20]
MLKLVVLAQKLLMFAECSWWICACLKSATNFNWSAGFSFKATLVWADYTHIMWHLFLEQV